MKLISVSGIGPRVALNMLSAFDSRQLATAILTSDSKLLTTIPGIGKNSRKAYTRAKGQGGQDPT